MKDIFTSLNRLRRRVYTNTQEMWNYVSNQLQTIRKSLSPAVDSKVAKQIEQMLETAAEHKRSLLNDLNEMREADGYEQWRLKESIALSSLVQRRLTSLQHPEDCSKAQKLVCRLNKVSRKFLLYIIRNSRIHKFWVNHVNLWPRTANVESIIVYLVQSCFINRIFFVIPETE